MKNSFRQKPSVLFGYTILATLCILLTLGAISLRTVETVKVGGHLHEQVVDGRDLMADVLPPPLYIVEAFQVAGEMLHCPDQEALRAHQKSLHDLEKLYHDRLEFWEAQRADHAAIKELVDVFDTLSHKTRQPAEKFFTTCRQEFSQALADGDAAKAKQIHDQLLKPAYEQQRQAIDELVTKVTSHNTHVEAEVNAVVTGRGWLLWSTIVAAVALVGFAGIVVFKLIRTSEKQSMLLGEQIKEASQKERATAVELERKVEIVLEVVRSIAAGKFDLEIPDIGDDAIGKVASELRSAVTSIHSALQEVRGVACIVSTAAEQLNGAARDISSGAQSQASSLEETASSLEEITSTSHRTPIMLSKRGKSPMAHVT